MSLESRIRTALSGFDFPCRANSYDGSADTFFTFSMFSIPAGNADDAPTIEQFSVQLQLTAPKTLDISTIRKPIKLALFNAGFSWPEENDISDSDKNRIAFEFYSEEAI